MDLPPTRAPEIPAGYTWFNVDHPLAFSGELRGRVTVLDFWTYCCINCLHVIPDLAYLEHKYAHDPVVFIGVHSNKYTTEAYPENIRQAILRLGVTHPVVVDQAHAIWDAYAVNAWPTLAVIDPNGYLIAMFSGEGHREELDRLIAGLLDIGRDRELLADGPITLKPEQRPPSRSGLLFPGKVLADRAGGRLFIADSGHHRVLITDWRGEIIGFLGSGMPGQVDGMYSDARFRNPQGMALFGNNLYIADTDNHMVRQVDLTSFHVHTALGNGIIGYDRRGGHRGRDQLLNSPWDVAFLNGKLYIAMAGLHQIWAYDPQTEIAEVVAGTGREDIADNVARRAVLAQPSGLSAAGELLFFADSETSAVREYDAAQGLVSTLVGQGLFTFGDQDGSIGHALLQHPLGISAQGQYVYVADTYNHKIKRIDLASREIVTAVGTGRPGLRQDGKPALYEPGGLSIAGEELFIADTNNDRILHYNLALGHWLEINPTLGGQSIAEAA